MDVRYLESKSTSSLPKWIQQHIRKFSNTSTALASLSKFYQNHNEITGTLSTLPHFVDIIEMENEKDNSPFVIDMTEPTTLDIQSQIVSQSTISTEIESPNESNRQDLTGLQYRISFTSSGSPGIPGHIQNEIFYLGENRNILSKKRLIDQCVTVAQLQDTEECKIELDDTNEQEIVNNRIANSFLTIDTPHPQIFKCKLCSCIITTVKANSRENTQIPIPEMKYTESLWLALLIQKSTKSFDQSIKCWILPLQNSELTHCRQEDFAQTFRDSWVPKSIQLTNEYAYVQCLNMERKQNKVVFCLCGSLVALIVESGFTDPNLLLLLFDPVVS